MTPILSQLLSESRDGMQLISEKLLRLETVTAADAVETVPLPFALLAKTVKV